jgi:predicted NACHT family NTPase
MGHYHCANLAGRVFLCKSLSSFFAGRSIDRNNFVELCTVLDLNWEDLIDRPAEPEVNSAETDAIVQKIRQQIKPIVRERCGTMRVLDMTQPIELTGERGIYTNVNIILERLTGRNRLEIAEILHRCGVEEFNRAGLGLVTEQRVPGLEAVERHNKLMVLGKPGAGKTTFLKYLAMQCIEEDFQASRIPVFITLKDFAEAMDKPTLAEYISWQCLSLDIDVTVLGSLFKHGRALVLLDGLDEVREEDNSRILKEICDFSEYFCKNKFVITCRIAAKEYMFEQFTEVEVADFDEEQIAIFAQNWFRLIDPVKAECFIQKLEENKPIQELASSPLLLTMLCLVFGESADFPANRSELYEEGLDILLKKWDGKRNIQRDQFYKNLSKKHKEDLLSQIALMAFEQKEYFFKQKTLEAYISDFILNLPNVDSDPEILRMDSEAVLKSIEAQHGLLVGRARGVYSFSHLTFQEYFAAKEIVANSAYENLVKHLTEKRWREVFLLTASMTRNADSLLKLIKQNIDEIAATSEKLQQFLTWINKKSSSVEVPHKPAAIRAFYLDLAYNLDFSLDLHLAYDLDFNLDLDLAYDRALDRALDLDLDLSLANFHLFHAFDLVNLYLDRALDLDLDPKLERKLQEIKDQLPDYSGDNRENSKRWWQENGQVWTEQLRAIVVEHRNIGHDWQFSDKQKELLEQYYDANKLLVDCLNSDCYVSRDVRQEIEDTLLLPMSEIEKREKT